MMNSISSNSLDRLASIYANKLGPNDSLPWVEIIASIFVIYRQDHLPLLEDTGTR